MEIKKGEGVSKFGKGINIELSGDDVARAIMTYLTAKGVYTNGAITIKVNGDLCRRGLVYVDPSGSCVYKGVRYDGVTGEKEI